MKKSTLFFKVMVLLALLVPWAAWGQDRDRLAPKDPPKYESWYIRGYKSITLTSEGKIPNDNTQKYKNINLSDVNPAWRRSLWGWSFDSERGSAIISPSNSGVTASVTGSDKSIHISGTPTVDAIYVRVESEHQKGWIKITFNAKKPEDVSKSLDISYTNGEGQKIYDGKEISDDDVRKGLTVKAGDVTFNEKEDYTVEVVNNSANVGEYSVKVTINRKGYTGSTTKSNAYEITARPVTVTLDGLKLEKGANGTNLNASDYASYFKIEEENNESKSGLVSGEKAKVTGTFDIDTQTVGDASFSTDDLDVVADNSSFASENYTIKWDGKATITKKDFSEGGEGGQGGTIIVTVVDKTYDGKPVDSPKVKDGETSLGRDAYVVEYYQGDIKLESTPIHAGEYKVVITPTETSDYDTESSITKDFTIKAAEITLTGSVTVEQGESLLESYDIKDFDNDEVNVVYEEGSSAIEELILTFKAAVTPTKSGSELTQEPSINVENAFNVQKTDGDKDDWLITISNEETATYKPGDITIKAITITLIVEAKKVDWTDDSNTHAEVTVYVNDKGEIVSSDPEFAINEDHRLTITLSEIETVKDWTFSSNPSDNQPYLSSDALNEYITWGIQYQSEGNLFVSGKKAFESLPQEVKVKIENGKEVGYLQINFAKDEESTEEPGGDEEAWADDENKKASITVYVDKSSGQPLKSEPAMDSKGFAIDLAKFEELEGEWSFATTDDNAIIDKDLSALYSFVVFEGDLLLEPQSEFNSESLSSVKVKIENGDNVGYLEINFKTITVIAEDDINKGGDDDNDDEQIDDDKITFVGEATGAKYVIYDGLPHGLGMLEITVDGETKVLKETDGAYDVVYGESEEEPVDAGTYSATITFNEAMGYSGTVILENSVKIEKRPLNISFSFSEPIEEGKVPTLDDAEISLGETSLGEGDYLTDCIDVTFRISNEQNADKKYDVYIEHISITNSTSENNGFNPSNYDITIVCKGGVSVKMEDTDGDGVLNDNDEDFNDDSVGDIAVDDIETVDPDTGEGSTGTFYKKYELYLANKDYLKNNEETREHYASEGLELFSRHNKKTTWAGGSFTIWYEHNGEMNEGGYRIFWSNRADGDYKEVKLDEVSGYYQIRNVNSNVYVKLYYETGFPVANEEITATDARAYAQANKIVVITPEPTDVQIISMAGAVVATDQVTGQREFANLAEGVYIVRMGETVIKLQVRN